jgi:hypothetical protein
MQHRNHPKAGALGCAVTLFAFFVFAVVVGAGLAIGWGLVN